MPGFTIHIAIAKQYATKHPKEIRNIEEFIAGSVAPDIVCLENKNINKNMTHYGKWGKGQTQTHLDEFLKDPKVDIKFDYWKGYFIHLLTDHYFYNIFFRKDLEEEQRTNYGFYYDYDCLDKDLIRKYHIEMLENIKKYMNYIEGQPRYLKIDKVIDFIDKIKEKGMIESNFQI